ncbi:hypothetical protein [Gemmata massiliana]|uniref:hypothetical protein n=1 Tax=Gemmata massiliana TaxID=1210884 RepID=UPI0013A6A694|nr:hypothetical protein [Gemmata massiliana]
MSNTTAGTSPENVTFHGHGLPFRDPGPADVAAWRQLRSQQGAVDVEDHAVRQKGLAIEAQLKNVPKDEGPERATLRALDARVKWAEENVRRAQHGLELLPPPAENPSIDVEGKKAEHAALFNRHVELKVASNIIENYVYNRL